MTALAGWENFYVIVGSSAGALIGLQFVVITLIADMPVGPGVAQASEAFATPAIVHFGAVLLLSGILSAPWEGISPVAVLWGLLGITGLIYVPIVTRRIRRQSAYTPELEDWLFHVGLPFAAYAMLAVSAIIVRTNPQRVLFGVAAAALLLLFIGIHNAWDAITYFVFVKRQTPTERNQ
jgi:hypothetical protein